MSETSYAPDVSEGRGIAVGLTIEEVADRLELTAATVGRLLRQGDLDGWKDGRGRWRVKPEDVQAYHDAMALRSLTDKQAEELARHHERIENTRAQLDYLVEQRNHAILRIAEEGASPAAIAQAVRLGRQNTYNLISLMRAERKR